MKLYFKNTGKKGQAALEFMMTYGWAILVVLAAIGALSYFGVLNPSRFTPDTCLASAPFSCPGKPLSVAGAANGNVTFSIINGQGYNVILDPSAIDATGIHVNLTGTLATCTTVRACTIGSTSCATSTPYTIIPGQGATVQVYGCTGIVTGTNIIKGDALFYYRNPESFLWEQLLVSVTAKPR